MSMNNLKLKINIRNQLKKIKGDIPSTTYASYIRKLEKSDRIDVLTKLYNEVSSLEQVKEKLNKRVVKRVEKAKAKAKVEPVKKIKLFINGTFIKL